MKLADLRPGWRTDFILHRFDAEVIERDDCRVVRTPSNPTFYWGNCLVLPCGPRDDELGHWLARFDAEVAPRQPASRHVAIGVDAPYRGGTLPAWGAAGFELIHHTLLEAEPGALRPPARAPRGAVELRRIDPARDADAVIAVEATVADPDAVAIGICRALGFHDAGTAWGLQRNAPQDRAA